MRFIISAITSIQVVYKIPGAVLETQPPPRLVIIHAKSMVMQTWV